MAFDGRFFFKCSFRMKNDRKMLDTCSQLSQTLSSHLYSSTTSTKDISFTRCQEDAQLRFLQSLLQVNNITQSIEV